MRREEIRATLGVGLGLAISMVTGFLREAALAHQLGASRAADIYLVAFALPEFAFLALPIIVSPAFIPLFAGLRQRAGEVAAWRFGQRVGGALLAFLLGASGLLALTAPVLFRWLAPGFDAQEQSQTLQAGTRMLPAISLMGGAVLAGAALQVYRRFARPALATAIYNLTFVVVLLALPLSVSRWPTGRAAWGVTLGAAAALLFQMPLLWRYRPPAGDRTAQHTADSPSPGVRYAVRLAGPLAAGYAVHHAILFVDRAMATTLGAGSVAVLNYGYRAALVVSQLTGTAVSTVLFPQMAEQAARDDQPGLRTSLAAGLRFVWTVGLPASAGLILLRIPVVQVLFERGAFDHTATAGVSQVLRWYTVAMLADALCQPLWRVVYAWQRPWTVLAINAIQTLIRLLANIALIPSLGYNGLALSAALGLAVQLAVLGGLVRRRLGPFLTAAWWRSALRTILATLCALVVAGLLSRLTSSAAAVVNLLASGVGGGLVYLGTVKLLESWRR